MGVYSYMRCKKAKRRLSAFLDNELKEKEGKEIALHLEGCSSCSKELKDLSFGWNILLNLKPVEAPAYLIQRTLAEVSVQKERLPWWYALLRPVPIIAACLIGILMGGFLGGTFYSNNNLGNEFASSISLNSFADIPSEWDILIKEEG